MRRDASHPATFHDDVEDRAATIVVPAHWCTVEQAARVLGISPTAVRKRVASGELTSFRSGRGRRVLVLGELQVAAEGAPVADGAGGDAEPEPNRPASQQDQGIPQRASGERDQIDALARTSESLGALVRDLQRQSLALAGQVGYLQHELVQANERVKLLEQSTQAPVPQSGVDPEEHAELQAELERVRAELERLRLDVPGSRRGWRIWRR